MKHNYDYIPQSILVFQNKKLIFANKYIKTIFLADSEKSLLIKLLSMLNLEEEEKLFDFFLHNKTFEYKDHTIGLQHTKKEYDLFLFTKLDHSVEYETDHPVLKQINTNYIELLSFFHGIKLQSKEKILAIKGDKLFLEPSKKQRLNLYDNREFFLMINNKCYSATCSSYLKEKNTITLEHISHMTSHPFQRDEVRLKIDTNKVKLPLVEKEFTINDLSEKSICLLSQEEYDEMILKEINSIKLPVLKQPVPISFFRKFSSEKGNKYVFRVPKESKELTELIRNKQRDILFNFAASLKKL